jgi:hypothetical protein
MFRACPRLGALPLLIAVAAALLMVGSVRPARSEIVQMPPLAVCLALDVSSSNLQPVDGYAAADPGPAFLRAALVRLFTDLVSSDSGGRIVLVGGVAFSSDIVVRLPLVDMRDDVARQEFTSALEAAMRATGWTSVDRATVAWKHAVRSSQTRLPVLRNI